MKHVSKPNGSARLPAAARPRADFDAQPDSRAGTIYERAQRRRPHDRRQDDANWYLDTRADKGERRRDRRRGDFGSGRRQWPEPPEGVDIWV